MIKKQIYLVPIAMMVLIPCLLFIGGSQAHAVVPPAVSSQSAVLIDGYSGQVLYAKAADEHRPPASTTKIMTGLLALENGKLGQVVEISPKAAAVGDSSIYLEPGEKMSFLSLVKGALIKSGNDACVAIAESVAGSEDLFLWMMNRQVRLLGAQSTTFKNTNGLPVKGHYSSALDLAMIARYALRNPVFAEIVRTKETVIADEQGKWPRYLSNTNKLLWKYPGADGVKTGTTNAAGQCLVASATRNGRSLLAVVLKSGNRFGDTGVLLDYGFNNLYRELIPQGDPVGRVYVKNGEQIDTECATAETLVTTVPVEEKKSLERQVQMNKQVRAPVSKGQIVGRARLLFKGQEVSSTPVLAMNEIKPATMATRFRRIWKTWGPTKFLSEEGIHPWFRE